MQCILNHCHENIIGDLYVVGAYGGAVLVTLFLALAARSRSIRSVATLIAVTWVYSLFAFFYLNKTGFYLVAVMLDTLLAYAYWRMAQKEIFPALLAVGSIFEIAFIVCSQAVGFSEYLTHFVLNRLFELTLFYVASCAVFRIFAVQFRRERGDAKD